jgi:cytochrome c oxidase subunit 3/cytochrome c oxidase subunit I+III
VSEIGRSGAAESAVAAAYAERRRRALPSGIWGAALFVATEATLFGSLLATYFFLRFQSVRWPPAGVESPKVALPLALTAALVATTLPVLYADRAARAGRTRAAWLAVLAALAIQCGYLAVQIILFKDDLNSFSPTASAYGSIYFTIVAAHHVHVLLGILLSFWLVARLSFGMTGYRLIAVRVVVLYWCFVNALAVLVVLTQVSPSL